jgi:hypothetical protein
LKKYIIFASVINDDENFNDNEYENEKEKDCCHYRVRAVGGAGSVGPGKRADA